ncbi:MAG: cobalamin B12-binding domain-containing protein [Deltaproteobacteria bacterium]|nr:cobalamin B12-binding domain-containing protein [Deltaproteobacteria bacterium]
MEDELSAAVVELRRADALRIVAGQLDRGADPLAILEACRQGMTLVGERFQAGDYFLSELLLAAEIFKTAATVLEPHLTQTRSAEPLATVVVATMRGDIHDLGKNIFATLLRARGFSVHDLGVNVMPALLLERVRALQPDFVGFSTLVTTAFPSMKEAAELLVQAGLRNRLKLLVGGGVTTPAVQAYVGADFQTTDATAGVRYCLGGTRGQ